MKKSLYVFLSFLIAFVLASCTTLPGEPTKLELKTMSMFGGTDPNAQAYEAIIAKYKTETGNLVNDSSATSDEIWKTSVISAFYQGNDPDVLFYFTGATAKPLVDNKKVVSIADIRKEYPNYAKNVADSVLDPYAVTLKGFVEGIFVNTELFTGDLAPYLAKEVWTYAEIIEIANKLIAKDIVPFALGANDVPHYWIEHLVLGSLGPTAFTNIPKPNAFNADSDASAEDKAVATKWVEALKLMKTFGDNGFFGTTKGAQGHAAAEALFKNGDAAMILDGSWFAGGFNETTKVKASKMKMMPFFAIPENLGGKNTVYMQSGFTSGFYISTKAWNDPARRAAAVKFVEMQTSTAAIKTYAALGGIPADPSVVLENLNNLQISMNSMPGRTTGAILPLSDAAKSGSFGELVNGAANFLSGNDAGTRLALIEFAKKQ